MRFGAVSLSLLVLLGCEAAEPPEGDPPPAPDAGPDDPCEVAGDLGTFNLGAGFELADTSRHGLEQMRLAANPDGDVFGLRSSTQEVVSLGQWPDLQEGAVVGSVVPGDLGGDAFLSPWLTATADGVAAGYTESFNPDTGEIPGAVTTDVEGGVLLAAPGNFTAASYRGALLVNSLGLNELSEGAAIYYADVVTSGVFARFEREWFAFSGFTAVTSGGVVVVGGFYAPDEDSAATNRLHAATPAEADAALGGAPLSIAALPEIASGDITDVAPFGDGVALLKAPFGEPPEGVERVPLDGAGIEVEAGAIEVVLERGGADCTAVDFLAPLGDDLLVGLSGDSEGERVVRVTLAR
jgi:hypothetical protein